MPTVSLKQAVIKWIKRGNYCLLLGLWLWKDLIESNETIAHALRYIIPFDKGTIIPNVSVLPLSIRF